MIGTDSTMLRLESQTIQKVKEHFPGLYEPSHLFSRKRDLSLAGKWQDSMNPVVEEPLLEKNRTHLIKWRSF